MPFPRAPIDPRISAIAGGLIGATFPPEERALQIILGMGIGYMAPKGLELSAQIDNAMIKSTLKKFVSFSVSSFLWYSATHSITGVYMIGIAAGLHTLSEWMLHNAETRAPILNMNNATHTMPTAAITPVANNQNNRRLI